MSKRPVPRAVAPTPPVRYQRDPVRFIDDLITVNERGQPFTLFDFQREVLRAAFLFDKAGRLPWDTFVYATIKKSGKSTLNAALTAWWSYCQEAPNECYVLANDQEQAQSRVFSTLGRLIKRNPGLQASAVVSDKFRLLLSNETEVRVLASEYAGAAGGNQGWTSWDELWASVSEGSRRLWEEMGPVPTRRNSLRFISTYAGFEGESDLLYTLYKQGVGPEEHPDGQGVRIHPTLPLYLNAEARLLTYWDHTPRLPWQTERYYASERRTLRPSAYTRLHENRWTTSEAIFLTPELWDPNVDPAHHPLLPTRDLQIAVGVDAGIKHDQAACVAVARTQDAVVLIGHRLWTPTPEHPLDLEATIEAWLIDLCQQFTVTAIACDPYQLHRSITTLAALGLPIYEYAQTVPNLTRAGQTLYDLLKGRNLVLYPADDLRQQALHTVGIETPRGFRIGKEKASRKIDGIVALAMACVAALDTPVAVDGTLTPEEEADQALIHRFWNLPTAEVA